MENKYLDNPEVVVLLKLMECENSKIPLADIYIYIYINITSTCWKILIFIINVDHSMDLVKDITKIYEAINLLMH